MKPALIVAGVLASPIGLYVALGPDDVEGTSVGGAFVVPTLTPRASEGKIDFASSCGGCHGNYGEGSDVGPPLMHPVYAPEALPDEDIKSAIANGVPAKRWPFGDMPAIASLDPRQVENMIGFLRELQAANDIR